MQFVRKNSIKIIKYNKKYLVYFKRKTQRYLYEIIEVSWKNWSKKRIFLQKKGKKRKNVY